MTSSITNSPCVCVGILVVAYIHPFLSFLDTVIKCVKDTPSRYRKSPGFNFPTPFGILLKSKLFILSVILYVLNSEGGNTELKSFGSVLSPVGLANHISLGATPDNCA